MNSILLIMPYGSVGGMERLAVNFYNYYKNNGYSVKAIKIIKLESDIINFGEDEIFLSNIDFCEMSFSKRFLFYLKTPFLIHKIIKQNKTSHSIAFGDMANIFSSLTFTNEYKIASIHALKSVEFINKSFLNTIFKLGFKTSYINFDKVVCISSAIKVDLIKNCGFLFKQKLKVIYNPHDIQSITNLSKIALETKEENTIFDKKTVLFLGRLCIQKAPWHLIKAFSLLIKKSKSYNLVLIGDGDVNVLNYINELIEELQIKENVFLLGRKSNPYQYLSNASVLALSSYYEGTPNVIVEAITCEIPIVSSNCTDGIIELMSNKKLHKNGDLLITESGIITPNFFKDNLSIPENNEFIEEEIQFSNALEMILSDDNYKTQLILNKKTLLEKFEMKKIAEEYLQ
jgi:glycosyltransferase involved in cell wall biosynthesis